MLLLIRIRAVGFELGLVTASFKRIRCRRLGWPSLKTVALRISFVCRPPPVNAVGVVPFASVVACRYIDIELAEVIQMSLSLLLGILMVDA